MAATVQHRLLIFHPDDDRVLLERGASGWDLPQLTLPELHTALVEHINAAVRQRWGIETTVLFTVDHSTTAVGTQRTLALEAHPPPKGGGSRSLKWGASPFSVEAPALPWAQRGWWPGVRRWIEGQIGETTIVQVRAWESSCVARVHAGHAAEPTHWFKASATSITRETPVTAWLAGRPGAPEVVACDAEHQWLLLRHFPGSSLDDVRDPAAWASAAATWGRLQATTLGRTKELLAFGCVARSLGDLAAQLDPLLADREALMPGHPEGMSAEQIASFHRFAPQIAARAHEVSALGLAPAIDHGDLWPSNILAGDGGCVIIDWEDVGIAHPFLSLGPLARMLREWQIRLALDDFASHYLVGLLGAERVREIRPVLLRSLCLAFVEMAIRYWRMPADVVRLNPWMRETVPFFLRGLLALEAELSR